MIFKVVVATRQPSEDKEFWHSEMLKLNSGGVVSGAGAEEKEDAEDDSLTELEELSEEEAGDSPPPPKPEYVPAERENFGSKLTLTTTPPEEDTDSPAEEGGKEVAPDSVPEEELSVVSSFKAKIWFCKILRDSSAISRGCLDGGIIGTISIFSSGPTHKE